MTTSPETRYTLIGKLRDMQDAEAWSEFTQIYQPLIFRICLQRGLQHADATDVTQEVLARVANAIEKFDCSQDNSSFRGWLFRVTRNLVVDFFRQRQRSPLVQSEVPLSHAIDPRAEESAEFQIEYVRQIFFLASQDVQKQVQPTTWEAFWRTEIDGRAVADVADQLNMKPGSVYMARSRVLARLKSVAEQHLNSTRDHFVPHPSSTWTRTND